MIKFYMEDAGEALKETGSTLHGLESREAEIRLEKNGPNKLAEPERESLLLRFAKQLKDPMIWPQRWYRELLHFMQGNHLRM